MDDQIALIQLYKNDFRKVVSFLKIPQEKFSSWTFISNYQDVMNIKNLSQKVTAYNETV